MSRAVAVSACVPKTSEAAGRHFNHHDRRFVPFKSTVRFGQVGGHSIGSDLNPFDNYSTG